MIRSGKPKKNSTQLIAALKNKGVSFKIMSETEAAAYLEKNNYLRTAGYRRNFEKYQRGSNAGKYLNLDFAFLAELSSIDKQLREPLLSMCIDVEHALKSKLLASIEANEGEDGYSIVDSFLAQNPRILDDIETKSKSVFTEKLINNYFDFCIVFSNDTDNDGCNMYKSRILCANCPAWVFVELLSFGDLIKFIDHYNQHYPQEKCLIPPSNELAPVKSLRNACAHNNCILIDMNPTRTTTPSGNIANFVNNLKIFSHLEISKKLSCRPMFEIIALLKCYMEYVSPNVRLRGITILSSFVSTRLYQNINYFSSCKLVISSFDFLKKTIDKLVKLLYNN